MRILMPKSKVDPDGPLLFLAGPIRDAPPWHDEAMRYCFRAGYAGGIATPTRSIGDSLAHLVVRGTEDFHRQRAWERHNLKAAATGTDGGCVMFWLPRNAGHHCEKSYGAMSRVEFGEWLIWRKFDPAARIVVGTDYGFSEIDTMLDDLKEYAPDLPVYHTLDETCDAALEMALRKQNKLSYD